MCQNTESIHVRQDGRRQSYYNGDSNKESFEKSLQNKKKVDIQNNKILDRITVSTEILILRIPSIITKVDPRPVFIKTIIVDLDLC